MQKRGGYEYIYDILCETICGRHPILHTTNVNTYIYPPTDDGFFSAANEAILYI